jgi:Domain of unknown function (DUF4157)
MQEHRFADIGGAKSGLLQPSEEIRSYRRKIQSSGSRGSNLTVRTSCRLGDRSCVRAHASRLGRETIARSSGTQYSLMHLQRHFGNRYVQRVLAMRSKSTVATEVQPDVEETIQSERGGGHQLDNGVRSQMESSFGSDFGGVRVHTGAKADALNQTLGARAFTTGQDIFFGQNNYDPGSSNGRELIAHELTHVVQQNKDEIQPKLTLGQPGDRYEQEADSVARMVIQQEQGHINQETGKAGVRRQPEEEEELQAKVQRQEEEEEEFQAKVQRQEEEEEALQPKI